MDASLSIQGSIHVGILIVYQCPEKRVHIISGIKRMGVFAENIQAERAMTP